MNEMLASLDQRSGASPSTGHVVRRLLPEKVGQYVVMGVDRQPLSGLPVMQIPCC
jgi:hypothetical protein